MALGAATRSESSAAGGGLILPRLVGSGSELAACARSWNGESILLEGADASRQKVLEQLRRNPAVIHFATHILATNVSETHAREGLVAGAPDRSAYGLIALSLTARNELELLTPMEIARWKVQAGLVVLSGCDSAQGTVLQGTGLMGLTRAWLAAGAQFVVSSRWATTDEDGSLFRSFYGHLGAQGRADPVGALRAAQLEMIHSGDWRARPSYWGAYFMTGNQ
jgi:CHAT domain-containing protein